MRRVGCPISFLAFCLLAVATACRDSGPENADGADRPLLTDPFAVEILVQREALAGPRSERPNRFFDGWTPITVRGREGFRASAAGASFQVVTIEPGERRLGLDLLDDGRLSRPAHVRVRIDRGEPVLVPVVDPLTLRLPETLATGRHLVEVLPRRPEEPALLVAAARVRSRNAGRGDPEPEDLAESIRASLGSGTLFQAGPSAVDTMETPFESREPNRAVDRLLGEVCPTGWLAGTGGFSVRVTGPDGRGLGRWEGGGGLLDWLRGCRRFEIPIPSAPSQRTVGLSATPVRVRLLASEPDASARWRNLGWRGTGSPPDPPRRGTTESAGRANHPHAEPGASGRADALPPPRLVLVYVLDALRADFVGHLGGPEGVSPTIDRLAEEGFTFRRHRSNAPNTLPSIRELFTGRIYLTQRSWEEAGRERPTLAEAFRDAGYRTGLFSGNLYTSARYGLARGFDHVSRESLFEGTPAVNRNADKIHAEVLDWLQGIPRDEPVFLYVQTIHPHNPYAPPERFERRFTAGIPSRIRGDTAVLKAIEKGELQPSEADRDRLRGLYAASLAYNDARLDRLLAALGESFAPEETLVVVTSDHGEELFDHGGVLHGYTLYEELLQIPLVVWSPGRVHRGESVGLTDMLDLHATLLELAREAAQETGRDDTGDRAGELDPVASAGRSLLPLLTGRTSDLPAQPSYAATWGVPGGIFAVRDGPWKLIRLRGTPETWWMGVGPARTRDREHLFDLATDPRERDNLAGSGGVPEQWLRARLRSWIAAQEAAATGTVAPEDPAGEEPLDAKTRQRLRALGYLD